jgi:C-terminal processing protease CtpA/Prc
MVRQRPFWALLALLALLATACIDKPKTAATPASPGNASISMTRGLVTPQDLAAQPGGVDTVRVAYGLLMDKFYKPVKSNGLLRAAWQGVVQELSREGHSDPGTEPTFSGDREADIKAFSDAFDSATAGLDKGKIANSAVQSMARSLHDDHTAFLPADTYKQFAATDATATPHQVLTTKMLPDGIGYLKLNQFPPGYEKLQDGKTLSEELDAALADFEAQGVKGWVLDLRNNGGGHTESISTIVGRFVPNGLQETDVDGAGNRYQVLVNGHYYAHPHPLAVLINGGSASASEITASALKDYGAARLFGSKTAGAVNGAEIQPLPGQVGLEYTVVQALAGKTGNPLDKVGVEPDETVTQQSGEDTQLKAAQAWISSASTPAPLGTPEYPASSVSADRLRAALSPYAPAISNVPPLPNLRVLGDVTLTTPGDYTVWAPCTTDAEQLQHEVFARDWQGQFDEFYGNGDPFTYQIQEDLYADAAGAHAALQSNECPQGLQAATLPVRLGDESVAYRGTGILDGWTLLRWRRDRTVFSTFYYAEPGLESFDPLIQIGKAADANYAAKPLK